MILEHAVLPVRPGRAEEFEAAFADAQRLIAGMAGFRRLRLSRCVQRPDVYLLLVEWDQLEDHTVGFRGSPEYRQWSERLHHFYDPFPVVEHFATVLGRGTEFAETDRTGAHLRSVQLNGAHIRTLDMAAAVVRDVDLSGTTIDGAVIDGLRVNGVEIAPIVEAELTRREPARALRRASDPADLREAWQLLEASWEQTYARVSARPALADRSADGEWSFTETLRHLLCATDAWLGTVLGNEPRYHPWGLPFSGVEEFVDGGAEALGLDVTASPSYAEVLAVRKERVAKVRDLLAGATPEGLVDEVEGPPWASGEPVSVLRCVRVVLSEEIEHHRFAQRDLDLLDAAASDGAAVPPAE